MDANIRGRLEELAAKLHVGRHDDATVESAHREVSAALEAGHEHGLRERLELQALELDTTHPGLSTMIRTIVSDLSAMGI